ncbi:hypothetical protein BZL30_5986 [Mycobacterium kansasii]|uniref:Uncharacterized protein n=1 Tax=Mycobacterium kansasii TaxID=1768 RepID=A0A1V3WXR3_MYCKA|nr:hypothetical protein BZL30_5986 [Mycobacterium kansasii]
MYSGHSSTPPRVDAQWVGIHGAGHYMVRYWSEWHWRTTDFVADYLSDGRRYSPGKQNGK